MASTSVSTTPCTRPGPAGPVFVVLGLGHLPLADPAEVDPQPVETSDMIQSLINDADQCGAIPHWVNDNVEDGVMPGDAGSLIVSNAYAFGARRFDTRSRCNMVKMASRHGLQQRDHQRRSRELSADRLHHQRRVGTGFVHASNIRAAISRSRASPEHSAIPPRSACC